MVSGGPPVATPALLKNTSIGTEFALRLRDQRIHCGFIGNVARNGETADFLRNGTRAALVHVDHYDFGALRRERSRTCGTDAARSAGDDGNTTLQIHD